MIADKFTRNQESFSNKNPPALVLASVLCSNVVGPTRDSLWTSDIVA